MKRFKPSGFVLVWLFIAGVAAYFFHQWYFASNYLGLMETRRHTLGVPEAGKIGALQVRVGDEVKPGQLLASLDNQELERQKTILEETLKELERGFPADERRFALEFQQLQLALEADLSNLAETKALFASRRAELKSINEEIERLRTAENAGLGHTPDLTRLLLRRAWLERYVAEANASERAIERKVQAQQAESGVTLPDDEKKLVQSGLSERSLAVSELRTEIALLEERIHARSLHAPCIGRVVDVLAWESDTLAAFQPWIVIEETRSNHLQMYIPETADTSIATGTRVEITPRRRSLDIFGGTVVFVHPGFEAVPERLTFRNQIFWARKVRVKLDDGHPFLPGEAVHVRFTGKNVDFPHSAHAAPLPASKKNKVTLKEGTITVPPELARRTRFEPSALTWLDDLQRFIVLSDDTGWKNSNDKTPWIFLMDRFGNVENQPLLVRGVKKFNDLEAIAVESKDILWFVSSQNTSKKGKRKSSREKIYKVRREGRSFEVIKSIEFLSALEKSYTSDQLKQLGLIALDRDGRKLLNIEGAAWKDGSLYLGLKQPLDGNKAMVWKLDNPSQLLDTGKLSPNQLQRFAEFPLGDPPGGSISSLAFDASGVLHGLSTIANAGTERQIGRYFRLQSNGASEILNAFPGKKAEGLAFFEGGKAFIAFDADQGAPTFAIVSKGER